MEGGFIEGILGLDSLYERFVHEIFKVGYVLDFLGEVADDIGYSKHKCWLN